MAAIELITTEIATNSLRLYRLSGRPGQEHECRETCELPSDDDAHQLSVAREAQLADDMAFLCARTDNMHRVTAVALEESLDGNALTVRFAANLGDLSEVQKGLERVAIILQQAYSKTRSADELQKELFCHIVELDRRRILSRLWSVQAPKNSKPRKQYRLIEWLGMMVNSVSGDIAEELQINKMRPLSAKLQEMSSRLEKMTRKLVYSKAGTTILQDMLTQILELTRSVDLAKIRDASDIRDKSLIKKLPQRFNKLARYLIISHEFVRVAQNPKYRVLKKILIRPIRERVITPLHLKDPAQIDRAQARGVARAVPKQHAEMQLLLFYEQNADIRSPRMICASKQACYLCHLYIMLHGGFRVPRTHGKLYPGWIPPIGANFYTPKLQSALRNMNSVLEREIRDRQRMKQAVISGIGGKNRVVGPSPDESVIGVRVPPSPLSSVLSVGKKGKAVIRHSVPVAKKVDAAIAGPSTSDRPLNPVNPLLVAAIAKAVSVAASSARPTPIPTPPDSEDSDGIDEEDSHSSGAETERVSSSSTLTPRPESVVDHGQSERSPTTGPASLHEEKGGINRGEPHRLKSTPSSTCEPGGVIRSDASRTMMPVSSSVRGSKEPSLNSEPESHSTQPPTEERTQQTATGDSQSSRHSVSPSPSLALVHDLAHGVPFSLELKPPDYSMRCRVPSKINLTLCYDLPEIAETEGQKKVASCTAHWLIPSIHEGTGINVPCVDIANVLPGHEQIVEALTAPEDGKKKLRVKWGSRTLELSYSCSEA